jgi:hypothetical protein
MTRTPLPRKRCGLTHKDLLAALALVVLGGGLLAGAVDRIRGAAARAQSQNNLMQITIATINMADSHQGKMPRGLGNWYPQERLAAQNGYGSCLFQILPYMDQETLYKSSLTNVGGTQIYACWTLAGRPIKTFTGPADPTADAGADGSGYLANGLVFPWSRGMSYPASISDGTTRTIFFAEGYAQAVDRLAWNGQGHDRKVARRWWDAPVWTPYRSAVMFQAGPPAEAADASLPQGHSESGILVSLGDASVRLVSPNCSATTFYAACTPNGDDILGNDW